MCTVSMIGDYYGDKWRERLQPQPFVYPTVNPQPWISREEFDALKREVEDMKELLRRAKQYDIEHSEPDCEMDEKLEVLRRVAQLVGVDLDDVLGHVSAEPGADV